MDLEPLDVVKASQDALAAGDLDKYVSMLALDVVARDPVASVTGRDGVRQHLSALFASARSVSFLERKLYLTGNKVAMKFTLRLETIAGREGTFEGIDVFELNDGGQIQRITSFYNPGDLAGLFGAPQ